jgi:hypothetical protein
LAWLYGDRRQTKGEKWLIPLPSWTCPCVSTRLMFYVIQNDGSESKLHVFDEKLVHRFLKKVVGQEKHYCNSSCVSKYVLNRRKMSKSVSVYAPFASEKIIIRFFRGSSSMVYHNFHKCPREKLKLFSNFRKRQFTIVCLFTNNYWLS